MKLKLLSFLALITLTINVNAQEVKEIPFTFSLTNTSTSLPTSSIFGINNFPIHPGITIGSYTVLKESEKSKLIQNYKIGYFYHRLSQQAIQLYTETEYQTKLFKSISGNIDLGVGYLHSFNEREQFELNDNGDYVKKKNFGKAQLMFGTSFGLSYSFLNENCLLSRVFINSQFWFQTPFVKSYVPLLPQTTLYLGVELPIKFK